MNEFVACLFFAQGFYVMNNLWNRLYLMELFTSSDLFVDTTGFFKSFIVCAQTLSLCLISIF